MKYTSILLLLLCNLHAVAEEPGFITVFQGRSEGYHTYRIPSMIATQAGTVLAMAEGRRTPADHAENDLVLKRSVDHGATWSDLKVVAEVGRDCLNNPTLIQITSGRIWLMYQRYPRGIDEKRVVPGLESDEDNICRNFVQYSDDDGVTWSTPREITKTTKRPTGATSIASAPGNGIQLRRGEHEGRIIIPFNQGPLDQKEIYVVYSDDEGATWAYGDFVPKGKDKGSVGEVQVVELTDGAIMINARSRAGSKLRKSAVSRDGGQTWTPYEDVPELIEPQCNASFIRISDPLDGEKSRILYIGPASQEKRVDGSVWMSTDEGKTWPLKKPLMTGHFAYSSSARLADHTIGCLFETGEKRYHERIDLAKFNLQWLNGEANW